MRTKPDAAPGRASTGTPESGPRRRFILLHPAVIMGAVWAVVVPAWWLAPDDVLATSISGDRAGSLRAGVFFSACLLMFIVGSVASGMLFQSRAFRLVTAGTKAGGIGTAATVIAGLTLFGGIVWILRIALVVGGLPALMNVFLAGDSVAQLKSQVYTPAQLPPITTMVHLAPAAASILLIHRRLSGGWSRFHLILFIGVLGITAIRTLALAERLAGLGVLSAIVLTLLLTSDALKVRRLLLAGIVSLGLLWFAWSAGEFSRSWMDSRDGAEAEVSFENFKSSLSYSQMRLQAYLFTAINNGVIIVDEWPGQEFPSHFAPASGRVPGVASSSRVSDLYDARHLNREFTGLSMPGTFYLDAREMGVVLALMYGLIFGLVWRAASLGSIAGTMLYASIVQVLLDSYRSAYLFDIQGIAAFAAVLAVLLLASPAPRKVSGGTAIKLGQRAAGA
jgi:hypothetical protein